jgi:hypothetical protein
MNLIITVCFALAGSVYQDHCREELAQEVIAEKSPLWEGEHINGFKCDRRRD